MDEASDFAGAQVEHLGPEKLARLLGLDTGPQSWKGEDAGVVLRAQLGAALLPDLLQVRGAEEGRLRALVQGRPGAGSFGEQLAFVHPSLELLQAIKAFAREVCSDADNPLHGSAANVLYFGAIGAALVRCGERITTLSDEELREGFAWALRQAGVEQIEAVLRGGLEQVCGRHG